MKSAINMLKNCLTQFAILRSLLIAKFLSAVFLVAISAGCSVEVSVKDMDLESNAPKAPAPIITENRTDNDFINGEIVVTSTNYKINGVFAELSEKQTTTSGYTIEGVFQ